MRGDRDRILDMIEMCDLILEHAADPDHQNRNVVADTATANRTQRTHVTPDDRR